MKLYSIIAFIAISILGSCSSNVQKPEPLLSQSEMIDLLTNMHLTEVALQQFQAKNWSSTQTYTNATYKALFEKYGLNKASFEANMYYHTYHSRNLEEIYTEVARNLFVMDSLANVEM